MIFPAGGTVILLSEIRLFTMARRVWKGTLCSIENPRSDILLFFLVARVTGGKLIPSDVKQAAEVDQWVNIADQEVRTPLQVFTLPLTPSSSSLSPTAPSAA
jgi:hypothetical protein